MKFGVRLVEVKLVKKATKNGVPPNLGDSGPSLGGPVQRPDAASESASESLKDRKRKLILKQVSQTSK